MKAPSVILCIAMSVLSVSVAFAEDSHIYMMARAKFVNTTFTQIVFFEDPEVDSLEKCQREKAHGERGNWQYYGHHVNRYKGAALGVNYYCLATPLDMTFWYEKNRYKFVYLVSFLGTDIGLKPMQDYAACMAELRKTQPEETVNLFCAKSNQTINAGP